MPTTIDRESIAQIVIVLALCIGGWLAFVEPKATRAAELQTQIRMLDQMHWSPGPAPLSLEPALARLETRVRNIEHGGQLTTDTAYLYQTVSSLAREHGVRVRALKPGGADRRTAGNAQHRRSFQVEADATYEQMASFLGAMQRIDGFLTPVSLVLNPTRDGDQRLVRAFLTCELYTYPVPDLANLPLETSR